jgi:dihydroxyacid dehydratase/phosphogluconate dehydratase
VKPARQQPRPTEINATPRGAQKRLADKSCRDRVQTIVNREIVAPRYTRGVLAKYAAHVTSASFGAVTDMDLKL